jgi:DNA (cytosine-5)-methyltransferase 1
MTATPSMPGVVGPAIWQGHPQSWLEAEVIAEPVAKADEPRVLVRRKESLLAGPRGEDIMYCVGNPAISLFTGAGGMDIGLEKAGFCCRVQHEWMADACKTLIANRPRYFRHAALIQGDIRKTTTGMLLKEAGLQVGEPHIVAGGPPCQGFSTANKHAVKNEADTRNDLVFEYLRVVDEAKPWFFIMENVPGFVRFSDGAYLKAFLQRAYGAYYELVYGLVDAVEYGVPQYRCRFICMGTRRDIYEQRGQLASLPAPQNFDTSDLERIHMLAGLPLYDEERQLILQAPGVRYFPDRPVLIPPQPTRHGFEGGRASGFVEFYRRLRREEPDRIVTSPGGAE